MTQSEAPVPGSIGWRDLTVDPAQAAAVRDFYCAVLGWTVEEIDMGGYSDFAMLDGAGRPVAGICHARGSNAGMPPQWILYVHVQDLDAALEAAAAAGGRVVVPERSLGEARFAVAEDPSGAVVGLYQA
jgi:predicted enzyme related to lactoylglutathione lyase